MTSPHHPNLIEVRLRNIKQLFNSMDPAPFHEKDLGADADEFITSWALEYPRDEPLVLAVRLDEPPDTGEAQDIVTEAVHHFYAYRAQVKRRELRELLRRGRTSLVIGLAFLAACIFAGQLIEARGDTPFVRILQESMLIGGWVAMWRPLEIFLYDWWPIRHMRRLFEKMSRMEVRVRVGG